MTQPTNTLPRTHHLILHLLLIITILHIPSTLTPQTPNTRPIDRTIARINNDILTKSDLTQIIADTTDHPRHTINPFEHATTQTVASMFDRALLLQEAQKLQITPPTEELNRQVEEMVREIRANFPTETQFHQTLAHENLTLNQLKTDLLKKTREDYQIYHLIQSQYTITDHDLQQHQQQTTSTPQRFHLLRLGIQITDNLPPSQATQKAHQTLTQIITEGITFQEGVRKYSQVPGAQTDGGDMGYLTPDQLSPDIRNAIQNLQPGQATPPIIAGDYANIFYLQNKQDPSTPLRQQKFHDARNQLLQKLRHRANLQIYDSRLIPLIPQIYQPTITHRPTTQHTPANQAPQQNLLTPFQEPKNQP